MTVEILHPLTGAIDRVPPQLASMPVLDDALLAQFTFERVFAAADLETAMAEPEEGESFSEHEGKLIEVHAAWRRATVKPGNIFGWYLVLDATIQGGERGVSSTGSPQPMAVICRAVAENKLPMIGRIHFGKAQDGKSAPIFLVNQDRGGPEKVIVKGKAGDADF